MTVTVRLFAFYADRLGRSSVELDMHEGATVGDVVRSVSKLPGASALPSTPLVALNASYATTQTVVAEGDEVAIIPPVAGG